MKIRGLYHMPGSRFYWYRWTGQDGKRRAISLKTDDLPEAITKIREIKVGAAFARWESGEPVPTAVSRMVEKYLSATQNRARKPMRAGTAKRQRDILSKFLKDTLVETVLEVTREKVDHWLEGLKKSGRSPDTLRTYAQALRSFVGYLLKERLHTGAGFEKFELPERGPSGRKNWLQSDVANRVIAESRDPDLTFILLCGFDAGLRKSEIINARVNWFDLRAGLLHVQNDPGSGFVLKDRENRAIPLTEKFQKFLQEYLADRDPNSYVLKPGQAKGRAEYRYDFKRLLYTHFKRCGVQCSIHDMRRSFASNRVSQGRSIYKVAKWLGDGLQVVERSYGHLAPADRDIDIDVSEPVRPPAPSRPSRVSESSSL
jgi:integrase